MSVALIVASVPAWADDDDHDRAFGAVERGEALSLPEVMARAKQQLRGEVVGTAFNREHGRWIYEFKVVTPGGKLRRVYIDAASGKPVRDDDD
ncbi:PepSY domain-containing protein [Lichenifustis flavocetrariae]|uniref:PepSY domain-containing protein n=1 Tax=Lichenifustis flavocetrariae TaxID=2949735 RepID=A0AA41Z3G9_9HYPH|nr:PepSY domain-containing protein [Lichenifustis flavocetrariae]MCW6509655.1 PepSY domain-containing protein [Lichenifustis flavocetrariae]